MHSASTASSHLVTLARSNMTACRCHTVSSAHSNVTASCHSATPAHGDVTISCHPVTLVRFNLTASCHPVTSVSLNRTGIRTERVSQTCITGGARVCRLLSELFCLPHVLHLKHALGEVVLNCRLARVLAAR